MFKGGVVPSNVDKENYIEFLKVMNAKSREDRPMVSDDAHKKIARLISS